MPGNCASPVRRGAVGKGLLAQYLAGRLPYRLLARGASQAEAWWRACLLARELGLLARALEGCGL